MSGEDIPYQLRPNKFIDRQLFLELLARLIIPKGPEHYIYVSMGGRHLVDHHAVYNQLGISALYAFDKNPNNVTRQKFNRPHGKVICAELDSADLPARLDEIQAAFPGRENIIVWLDYTDTNRRSQLQEAVQTLLRLKHGDIFRITLNASQGTLGKDDEWRRAGAESPGTHRANQLRNQIQEYLPTEIASISDNDLPSVLARCVELAANKAMGQESSLRVTPVLITSYRDGARMLTVTCAISEPGRNEFPARSYSRWRFACRGWNDVREIYSPVLSTKEKHRLDYYLHRGAKRMLEGLKFLPNENEEKSLEALKSYRDLHRYYPTFRHIDE